jgi:hypothetical protein
MQYDREYISLNKLSNCLELPATYLKDLAKKGSIPALNVNGRLRFNPESVQLALDDLAAKKSIKEIADYMADGGTESNEIIARIELLNQRLDEAGL